MKIFVITLNAFVGVWLALWVTQPTMHPDPVQIPERAVEVAPLTRSDAHAEPAKTTPAGVCDYDDEGPCWCWGFLNYMPAVYGNQHFCSSATEYLLSVQEYGRPRGEVFVSVSP